MLVLLVVLAVNLVYLAEVVRLQMQEVYANADLIAREIYNEMSRELETSHLSGATADASGLQRFFDGLRASPELATLLSSAIGYNSAIRDVALVAPDGTVALDSNPLLEGEAQPQRRLMSEVLDSGLWRQLKAIFSQEQIYSVSLVTSVNQQPLATISIGVDTVLLRQEVLVRVQQAALYGALIVLLATGLAWGLADLALSPLSAISAQLDRLTGASAPPLAAGRDEFGVVSSKIQHLGQEMADARQVYSELQENVSQVLEGLEEGLLLFDESGQSVMASAAAPQLLGLPPGELVGRPVEALFAGSSPLDRAVRAAVRQKMVMPAREMVRPGGGRPLLARLDLVPDRSGQMGALLTLRDTEPVYRLESELEVARRLSAVGRLTRGVAHEVKNPLNAMAIHLDLLRQKACAGEAAMRPHLQVLGREIERLDRVVRTFLDFSRPVELKLTSADLTEVAHGVTQLAQAEASAKRIVITLSAPRPGPRVWLDRDLVEQALLNLVNNGLQAIEANTAPVAGSAAAPPSPAERRQLRLEVFEEDHQAVVRVRDHGAGVPPEHRDKIFDLYFTTRRDGTGIGLALAARIMQLHHGGIELESVAGPGASFLLRFPIRPQAEVSA